MTSPSKLALLGGLTSVAMAVTGLPGLFAVAAHADPAGDNLVISEAYGGGGNSGAAYTNDFVELYNPTGAPISLSGMSLQYRSAASTAVPGSSNVNALSGTVAPHGHFLIQLAAGSASVAALPTPDLAITSSPINMSGTGGQIYLVNGTTPTVAQTSSAAPWTFDPSVIDFVGFGSSTAVYEGTSHTAAVSNGTSVSRNATGTDTDDNAADFTTGTPTPQNAASDSGTTSNPVSVAKIADVTGRVGDAITPITPSATGGTAPYTWSATGLPAGVSIDPTTGTISGTPTASGDDKVTVTATDSTSVSGATTFYLAVAQQVSIAQIQGTDTATSPLSGQEVETQGVVTAVYATGGFNGFYLETGGAGGTVAQDQTPGASDAVFVYGAAAAGQVTLGESVDVIGEVAEYQGETEVEYPTLTQLGTPLPAVTPDTIAWSDLATDAQKEAHEGELMAPQGDFTVTDDYDTNFYGEIELAAGDQTLRQPTDAGTAGSADAQAAAAYNAAHAVTLDDGASTTFSPTGSSKDSPLPWLTPSTPVSIGASVTFHQPVVLDYRNSLWKLQPQQPVVGDGSAVATFSDMRSQKALPANVGGRIRLATFNVENFFPTTGQDFVTENPGATCSYYDDRAGTPISVDNCTFANGDPGPRGAATQESYQRQLDKIVYGINHLGASIVSLEEIENAEKFGHDRDWAVQQLVDALNADAGAGTWAFAPTPSDADLPPLAEQDVIRTAFIYKPADVSLVGASHVLANDSGAGQPFSIAREPMAQGFKAAGAQDSDAFMVVANHLKSKGSDANGLFSDCTGGDTENTDPASDQGGFNCTRVHEVKDMWAWAQTQAQALDTNKIFLVGDFNAYDHEDPMEYLYGQGFTDLGSTYDASHSSYSYDGLEGSLDHVLASPAAASMVTGATIWQINAQESVAFDYSRYNYSPTQLFNASDPFAASDHDPEVVGLNPPRTQAKASVSASSVALTYGQTGAVKVKVTGADGTPTGTVSVRSGTKVLASHALVHGAATLVLARMSLAPGAHTLSVTYSGDDTYAAASTHVKVAVAKARPRLTVAVSGRAHARRTAATLRIVVVAPGVKVGGIVKVTAGGRTMTARVSNGHATVRLPRFSSAGAKSVRVAYLGDSHVSARTITVKVHVAR